MEKLFAQVIIDRRVVKLDKPFTYLVNEDMEEDIEEGMRVVIPFGRGDKLIKGIVIGLERGYGDFSKFKYIKKLLDDKPLISKELIKLSFWMSKHYMSPYIDSLNRVLPPGDFKKIITTINLKHNNIQALHKYTGLEKRIIEILRKNDGIPLESLKERLDKENIKKEIKRLEKKDTIYTSFQVDTRVSKKYESYVALNDKEIPLENIVKKIGRRAYKQIEIVKYLYKKNKEDIPLKKILINVDTSLSTVKALEEKGVISILHKEVYRDPVARDIKNYEKHKLTKAQNKCVDKIFKNIKNETQKKKFLIHGVTGSGKTEVYLQLIEKVIAMGKQVIVLVPEISLTPQTVERFVGRFGENVAVLHSKLSFGERFDEWRKIKEGKVEIVVGARSAVFAPFKNLGLIVIDEEHETSYKSSMSPKYDTIEVAEKRCEIENAYLVLGTATPSIETYYRAELGEIELLNLPKRVNKSSLPSIKIIDMRKELEKGNKTMFSSALFMGILDNLKKGKQTILFLNRRGHSTFISCRKCGYVVECQACDVSMTYHFYKDILKCHYCGLAKRPPKLCPICKSKYIKYFGVGTQRVEKEVRKYFPKARVARMDVDTTRRKDSHTNILNKMKENKLDILIGTQMIAKGLDFPNVTLVGIIAADTSLNLPDYKSSERTFQLITQVAGRAGRGDAAGEVIVQTYNPNHFSIEASKTHDYEKFYNEEIILRKEFEFPPFMNLIKITLHGKNENKISDISKMIYNNIVAVLRGKGKEDILKNFYGPNPAPLAKIKNNYRWQILIKCKDKDLTLLKTVIGRVYIDNSSNIYKYANFNIDINPNSIL